MLLESTEIHAISDKNLLDKFSSRLKIELKVYSNRLSNENRMMKQMLQKPFSGPTNGIRRKGG